MNCRDCLVLMQQRLDGEATTSSPAYDDHLAACPSCRERNQAATRLREALKQRPQPLPSTTWASGIVASVLRDRALRRRRLRLRLVYTSALAASVLLLLTVGYFWSPARPEVPAPIAKHQPKEAPLQPGEAKPMNLVEERPATLGDRLADTTREQALVLWAAASPLGTLPLQPLQRELEPFDPAAQSLKKASREVTEGVQTVTRASRQAIAFFARELPILEGPQRN